MDFYFTSWNLNPRWQQKYDTTTFATLTPHNIRFAVRHPWRALHGTTKFNRFIQIYSQGKTYVKTNKI